MLLVGTRYTLNEKQLLTTTMLLKRAMGTPSGEGVGYQTSVADQFISYIGGTGGTGKTLLIKDFLFGLAILDKLDEVLLTAPTGRHLILVAPLSMPLSGLVLSRIHGSHLDVASWTRSGNGWLGLSSLSLMRSAWSAARCWFGSMRSAPGFGLSLQVALQFWEAYRLFSFLETSSSSKRSVIRLSGRIMGRKLPRKINVL